MLGLDLSVALALGLSVASAALCVVYGVVRWNADGDAGDDPPGSAQDGPGGEPSELGGR